MRGGGGRGNIFRRPKTRSNKSGGFLHRRPNYYNRARRGLKDKKGQGPYLIKNARGSRAKN